VRLDSEYENYKTALPHPKKTTIAENPLAGCFKLHRDFWIVFCDLYVLWFGLKEDVDFPPSSSAV
jgi:hypothetical protein